MQKLQQTGPNTFVWQTVQEGSVVKPISDMEIMIERGRVLKSVSKKRDEKKS